MSAKADSGPSFEPRCKLPSSLPLGPLPSLPRFNPTLEQSLSFAVRYTVIRIYYIVSVSDSIFCIEQTRFLGPEFVETVIFKQSTFLMLTSSNYYQ